MQTVCKQCQASFEVTLDDLAFYEKVSPVFGGKKYPIPSPTLCPDCRFVRRAVFRNERCLYKRRCHLCQKEAVTMYHSDAPMTVYCNECWWSDHWDPLSYGRSYDFDRPFFEQCGEFLHGVPTYMLHIVGECENTEYTNWAGWNRNCYLCFNTGSCEDCLYSRGMLFCRSCIDCYHGQDNERCYECINCVHCFNLRYAQSCQQCSDSNFLFDCVGCHSCIFSTNLRHKEYCILNEELGIDAYKLQSEKFDLCSYESMQTMIKKFDHLVQDAIHRENYNLNCEDCIGEYLAESKNCRRCFELRKGCEDCTYCDFVNQCKSAMDCMGHGILSELLYECLGTGRGVFHACFCDSCGESSELFYCVRCYNCRNCFSCSGLRGKEYCILNTQYTKEDYERLVSRIFEHMQSMGEFGEFFPPLLSPFFYNETVAQDYAPLEKEEALRAGFSWRDFSEREYQKQLYDVPDRIQDVSDSVLREVLACATCGRNYKIVPQELAFYRDLTIPVPRLCFDCRHRRRIQRRNPRTLWKRPCMKCSKEIQTSYAPERPEVVYCERCYLETVY